MDDKQSQLKTKLTAGLKQLGSEFRAIGKQLRIRKSAEWAIAWGMLVVVLSAAIFEAREALTGLGQWLDILLASAGALLGYFLSLAVGLIAFRLLRLAIEKISPLIVVSIGLALAAQIWIWGDRFWVNLGLAAGIVAAVCVLSLGVYLTGHLWKTHTGWLKITGAVLVLLVGLAGSGAVVWLFASPGQGAVSLPGEYQPGELGLDAEDPSEYGPYQVSTLTYGSGTDLRRPQYSAEVDLITGLVNATSYISFSGWNEELREWYWGFGMDEVPLNAVVWYPEGEGPFPLVLLLHGNHNMTDYSETGYEYLGELLASRGFIVASVDENFFNGGFFGKASSETDARAWLLLKHLEQWNRWNAQPDSPFYQQVDLTQIALVGHSRGGEAVGLAAAFNRLPYYPENGRIAWNYNFNIQTVIAIAPVDQQYKPGGHPAEIEDVNYLVIQGTHDGDVSSFKGIQQYERVSFSDPDGDYFKAAIYIYRANHGQFNSLWGNQDRRGVLGALFNKSAYLSEEDQRQIASVYVSAFLEATLHGREEYIPLFQDYHLAGDWLPATNYISQYQDGGTQLVADFEEDSDISTTSLESGTTQGVMFSSWRERALRFRNNDLKQNHVVRISWGSPSAYYYITLPAGQAQTWELSEDDDLVFLLADERNPFTGNETLDFTIVLVDVNGVLARVKLSEVIEVSPSLPAVFTKIPIWDEEIFENESEVVFQSVRIPLSEFLSNNPSFTLEQLQEIRFVFNQTPNGSVSLDEIGFDLTD